MYAINGSRAGMIWVWGEEIQAGSARPSTDLIHTIAAMRYLRPNQTGCSLPKDEVSCHFSHSKTGSI